MKPIRLLFLGGLLMLAFRNKETRPNYFPSNSVVADQLSQDTIVKDGYTLIFTNNASAFATEAGNKVKARLIDAFFKVYPVEVSIYNHKAPSKVYFLIDSSYTGVAEAANGHVRFSSKWMLKEPTDVDVVTHEVMHIVQGYEGNNPGWLVEGIADYARYKHGVDNVGSGWFLPAYTASQSYTDSYRITARFLVWLEKSVRPGLVKELDAACRKNSYSAKTWKNLTGKTVDELWEAYSASPII